MRFSILLASLLACSALGASDASAQFSPPSFNTFQNVLGRPTVSPYLNLINPGGSFESSVGRYQNYVRPQLDMQQRNRATDLQLRGIQDRFRQLEQVRSSAVRSTAEQHNQFITGHPSVFQYHSHYYQIGRTR